MPHGYQKGQSFISQPSQPCDLAAPLALWALINSNWSIQRELTWQKKTHVFILSEFTVDTTP